MRRTWRTVGVIVRSVAATLVVTFVATSVATIVAHPLAAQGVSAAAPAPAVRDSTYEVRLRDGSVLFGRVVEEDATRIVLLTAAGVRLDVPRAQIEAMRFATGRAVNGAYWVADPNSTRLFFTSTARALGKGEGYVASFMLFLPLVAYGVTDRFTIAGGTPIIPEAFGRVLYLAPKYTVVERERTAFAVGALGFVAPESVVDDGSLGIVYGAGTWGSRDRAITAGAGWGYRWASGGAELANDPVVMLGGETRVSRRVKLITENWMFTGAGGDGVITGGVRFIGDRLSADLGIGGLVGSDGSGCCLPLVNFVWNFGRRSP